MENHKTIVFGMGRSGVSALKLLNHLQIETLALNGGPVDSWASNEIKSLSAAQFSQDDFQAIDFSDYQTMVLSPGIPRTAPVVEAFLEGGGNVISEIELGYRHWTGRVLAITGTNGKTTTVSLLDSILRHGGVKVFTGGNIGIPFCDGVLEQLKGKDYEVALLELSSFQLESMDKFRPDIAAILNITMSHGERYSTLESYREAKFHLMDNMSKGDQLFCDLKLKDDLKGGEYKTSWIGPYMGSTAEPKLKDDLQIPGHHNVLNLAFAEAMAEAYGLSIDGMRKGVQNFFGVSHRLEKVNTSQLVYNDSKSTNWMATHTALSAVEKPVHLILGGQLRMKNSIGIIAAVVDQIHQKVEKLWFYGEARELLAKEFEGFPYESIESLNELVPKALEESKEATLVFSPGFPSFDQFKNFEERGESFRDLVYRNVGEV